MDEVKGGYSKNDLLMIKSAGSGKMERMYEEFRKWAGSIIKSENVGDVSTRKVRSITWVMESIH